MFACSGCCELTFWASDAPNRVVADLTKATRGQYELLTGDACPRVQNPHAHLFCLPVSRSPKMDIDFQGHAERGAAGQDTLFQAAAEGGGKEATGKGKKAKAK